MNCLIRRCLAYALVCLGSTAWSLWARASGLIEEKALAEIMSESSGELAMRHFANLLRYSGWAPSLGAEDTARYLAESSQDFGLADSRIEEFPSDGKRFAWAFRTEPWWEGRKGELWLEAPERLRLASFDVYRGHLARFSSSAQVTAELVNVGRGTESSDYDGKSIAGRIVLASGPVGIVHRQAVWERGALGAVAYRARDEVDYPDLVDSLSIEPFEGPRGERPAFAFSLSYRVGRSLAERLQSGEKLVVSAVVDAETRDGVYPQVHATIPGREPGLPEVWILAHTNHRNAGGGNNLTGVGATLEVARTLATLISTGKLSQPRRNIRFVWGAEHMAILCYFHRYPQAVSSVMAAVNLDMVGDHQGLNGSILRLYGTPHSLPSFVNDIVQEMFEIVADGNSYTLRAGELLDFGLRFRNPIVEPSGSRDAFYYAIEPFWGPSDHEDIAETSLGVPAVMLNTWPDPYIGTQEDSLARVDATQMKRAIVITAASAYVLASAGPEEVPSLAQNAFAKSRARLAAEERRAMDLISAAGRDLATEGLAQAANIIRHAHRREAEALSSLQVFGPGDVTLEVLQRLEKQMRHGEVEALRRLEDFAGILANVRQWGSIQPAAPRREGDSLLVPVRSPAHRGPVNFFRPQYGQDWMAGTLGNPSFREKVRLARFGHYYLYEALSFVNGQRNLGDIRDLLAAEYVPAPVDELAEYFRVLERAGVVSLRQP